MTSSLFIKKSTVSGTVPTLAEITSSELAINLGDGGLFYSDVTGSDIRLIRAGSASFAETASFALNAGAGGGGDPGETFNYFDPDKVIFPSSSLNDEFTNSGSLLPKWEIQNSGSLSASLDGDSLLTLTDNLIGTGNTFISQPIPSGSWVIRSKMAFESFPDVARHTLGLALQNQVNDRVEMFILVSGVGGIGPGHHLLEFTDLLTFNSTIESVAHTALEMLEEYYLEIDYNGVDIGYRISRNGLGFDDAFTTTRTTASFLAGAPTHFGILTGLSETDFTGSVDWFRIASSSADINGGLRSVGIGTEGPSGSVGPSGSIGPSGSSAPAVSSIPTSPPTRSLLAHYEGGVGFTTASGKISRWADQSGNGLDMTQSVAAAQPALSSSFDIFNSIEHPSFDGTDDFLEATMSSMVTASQFTWYEVHRQRNKSGGNGFGITVFTRRDQIDSSAAGNYVWFAGAVATTTRLFRVGTTLIAEPVGWSHDVQLWGVSNTSESWQAHRNGKLVDSGIDADGIAAAGFNNIYIGARQEVAFTPGGFNDMDLAELIVYEDVLTEVERTQVEEYLAGKYNIPIAHDPQIAPASGSAGATGATGPAGPGVFGGDFSGSFSGSVTGTFVGELEATGTLTGTLIGTASFAENANAAVLAESAVTALTASNANTASFADPPLFTAFRPSKTIANINPYNVLFEDYLLLIDASSGSTPIDVILPATSVFMKGTAGKQIFITKVDAGANNVQILASGSQTIIGSATSSLTDQYQGLTLQPSGNIWWVV